MTTPTNLTDEIENKINRTSDKIARIKTWNKCFSLCFQIRIRVFRMCRDNRYGWMGR